MGLTQVNPPFRLRLQMFRGDCAWANAIPWWCWEKDAKICEKCNRSVKYAIICLFTVYSLSLKVEGISVWVNEWNHSQPALSIQVWSPITYFWAGEWAFGPWRGAKVQDRTQLLRFAAFQCGSNVKTAQIFADLCSKSSNFENSYHLFFCLKHYFAISCYI